MSRAAGRVTSGCWLLQSSVVAAGQQKAWRQVAPLTVVPSRSPKSMPCYMPSAPPAGCGEHRRGGDALPGVPPAAGHAAAPAQRGRPDVPGRGAQGVVTLHQALVAVIKLASQVPASACISRAPWKDMCPCTAAEASPPWLLQPGPTESVQLVLRHQGDAIVIVQPCWQQICPWSGFACAPSPCCQLHAFAALQLACRAAALVLAAIGL